MNTLYKYRRQTAEQDTRLTPAEKWERARITNSFLFYKIMTANPEECRQLIEILLENRLSALST